MARVSAISPSTISQPTPERFVRLLEGRTSADTAKPRAAKACATADPTKPEPPVTSTRSPLVIPTPLPSTKIAVGSSRRERTLAFHGLPDQQYGHTDRDVAGPFQQGHGKPELRSDAKQRRQYRVSRFLHTQRIVDENGGASRRVEQALECLDLMQIDADSDQAQNDP